VKEITRDCGLQFVCGHVIICCNVSYYVISLCRCYWRWWWWCYCKRWLICQTWKAVLQL